MKGCLWIVGVLVGGFIFLAVLGARTGGNDRQSSVSRPSEDQIKAAIAALSIVSGQAVACKETQYDEHTFIISFLQRHYPSEIERKKFADMSLSSIGFGMSIAQDRNYPAVCREALSNSSRVAKDAKAVLQAAW